MMEICDTCGKQSRLNNEFKVCQACLSTYGFIKLKKSDKNKKIKAVTNILKNKKISAWARRYWSKVLYELSPLNSHLFQSNEHASKVKRTNRLDSKNYWND